MVFEKLNHSVKLDTENFSFSVSEKLHPLAKVFNFKQGDKSFMLHSYPGDKMVVAVIGNGSTELLSNAKMTKIDDKSVDVDI